MEATSERSGTHETIISRGLNLRSSTLDPPDTDKRKYMYKVSLVRTETRSSTTSRDSIPGPDHTPAQDVPGNAVTGPADVSTDKPRALEKREPSDDITKARSASLRDSKKTKYPELPNIVVHNAIYAQVYSPTKKRWRHVEFGRVSGSDSSEASSPKETTIHNGGHYLGSPSDRDSPSVNESTETDSPNKLLQQNLSSIIIQTPSKDCSTQETRGCTRSASPAVNGSPPRSGLQDNFGIVTAKYLSEENEQTESTLSVTGWQEQRNSQTESRLTETGGSIHERRWQKGHSNMAYVPHSMNSHERDNIALLNKSSQHTSGQKQETTLTTESIPKGPRNIISSNAGNRLPPEHTWHNKATSPGAKLPPRTTWQNTPLSIIATSPPRNLRVTKSSSMKAISPGSPWHNKPSSIMAKTPPSNQWLNTHNSTPHTSAGGTCKNKPSSIKTTPSEVSLPHNESRMSMATTPLEIPRHSELNSRFDFSPPGSPGYNTLNTMVPSPPESPLINKHSTPRAPSPNSMTVPSPPESPLLKKHSTPRAQTPSSMAVSSPPESPLCNKHSTPRAESPKIMAVPSPPESPLLCKRSSPRALSPNSMTVPSPPESPLLNKHSTQRTPSPHSMEVPLPPETRLINADRTLRPPSPLDIQESITHTGIMPMSPPGSPGQNKPTCLVATSPPGSPRKNSPASNVTEFVRERPEQCDSSSSVIVSTPVCVLQDDLFSMDSQSSWQSSLNKTTRTMNIKSQSESNEQEAVKHRFYESDSSEDENERISIVTEPLDKANKDNETYEAVNELPPKNANHIETSNKGNISHQKPSELNKWNETVAELEPEINDQYITRGETTELPPESDSHDGPTNAIAQYLPEISNKHVTSRIMSETRLRNSQNSGSCSGTESPEEINRQIESTKRVTEPLPRNPIVIINYNVKSSSIDRAPSQEEDNEPTLASVGHSDWSHVTDSEINISPQANFSNNLEFVIPDTRPIHGISDTCTTVENADFPTQHTNSEVADNLSEQMFMENVDVSAVRVPTLEPNDQVNTTPGKQTPMENPETMARMHPIVKNTVGSKDDAGIYSIEGGTASAVKASSMAERQSHSLEMEDDVSDINADMESWVDVLRRLETPEIMKLARMPRQPRTSPMSVYATLSPIEEDRVMPKSSLPLSDIGITESTCSVGGDKEEMEMDDFRPSTEMDTSVSEKPKTIYSWEKSTSRVMDLEKSSPLEMMRRHNEEDSTQATRTAGYRSLLDLNSSTRTSYTAGTLLLSERLEKKSSIPEHKPYSRLNSLLFNSYKGPDKASFGGLEKEGTLHNDTATPQDTVSPDPIGEIDNSLNDPAKQTSDPSEEVQALLVAPSPDVQTGMLLLEGSGVLAASLSSEHQDQPDDLLMNEAEQSKHWHNQDQQSLAQQASAIENEAQMSDTQEDELQNGMACENEDTQRKSQKNKSGQADVPPQTEMSKSTTDCQEEEESAELSPKPGKQEEQQRGKLNARPGKKEEEPLGKLNPKPGKQEEQPRGKLNAKPGKNASEDGYICLIGVYLILAGHGLEEQEQEQRGKLNPRPGKQEEEQRGKLNPRPGKIVIYTEPGLQGEQHEIWGDMYDATVFELPAAISIRVIRGGWVMYEKPRFQGRKIVLEEGDLEIIDPWGDDARDKKEGEEEAPKTPVHIGSLRHVVRDYSIPSISLFADENGEGTKVKFMDAANDARKYGQPLNAASIIVHSGLWVVYQNPCYEGHPCALEPGGYPNLRAWGGEEPKICSLQPIQIGCPTVEKPYEPKIILFARCFFEGLSWEINRDVCKLKKEDDSGTTTWSTVGSLRVLGGCWVGYEREGFRGQQYLLEEGEYRDWQDWGGHDDYLRSIRLIRADFSEPSLVMHAEPDLKEGPFLQLTEAIPDVKLAQYWTATQSILVHSGVWVAYENVDYSGAQYILEKGTYHNCQDWGASTGKISSLLPILQVGDPSTHYQSQIHLFSQPGFVGEHHLYQDEKGSLPEGFSPQSCSVHGGSWILYENSEFTGQQYILSEGEYPTPTAMGCVADTVLRSLMQVPIHFSLPSISLHGLANFEGKEIDFTEEVRSLQAEGFNNHVLSVRVKGGIWVLYEHNDYRGRQWLLDSTEIPNWLEYSGVQRIGSLRPIRQKRIYFHIRNRASQQFLCIKEEVVDMTAARVLVSEPSEDARLVWYYEDGRIKNQAAPEMSLQVIGAAHKGCKVVLWSQTRMPCQMWRIDPNGHICSLIFEGMILDVKGGQVYDRDHVILWTATEEKPTQMWTIEVL